MIVKLIESPLETSFGTFIEHLYYDGRKESIALVMGDVAGAENLLCRVHSACIAGHVFNSIECDCRQQMAAAQQLIQEAGKGIVIWMDQEGKANGHFALLQSKVFKRRGMPQGDAYEAAGFQRDARDFRPVADILKDLGVISVVLLTDSTGKTDTLTAHGVPVAGTRALHMIQE